MKRKIIIILIIIIMPMFFLSVNTFATPIDTNADPVPIVTSGSFVCTTWINTSLDSFNIGGAGVTMTEASWGFSQGYVMYKLSGTFIPGEISLGISGTMGEMGYAMEHKGNNLHVYIKCYDVYGLGIPDLYKEVNIKESFSGSLSDTVSIQVPNYVKKVELFGSFSCNWVTPFASASETVGVNATLESETEVERVPQPTTPVPGLEVPDSESLWSDGYNYPTSIRFADMHGEVNVKRAGEDDDMYIFAEMDTPLRHGDVIRTLPNSGAILSFSDMSTYVMPPDTVITLDLAVERDSMIGLVAGRV